MKKGIVALILIVAAIPFFVLAYVSPGKPAGYVNDFARVLSASEKTDLEANLTSFEKQTGDEISVVTVPTLEDETVESYAVKLFEEWGIGKKGKDNGALLLVAMNEKKLRIEVGYGLEPYLTDAQSSSIIRNIISPAFKEGKFAEGIQDGVEAMKGALQGQEDAVPADTNSERDGGGMGVIIYILLFIPIWLGSILARSRSWWAGGVIGGIAGVILGFIFGFVFIGIISIVGLTILGLIFDFIVSKAYHSRVSRGLPSPWWIGGGGGRGGFGGGGFGGFGGGGSGGGGASGGW
jgi:uncharacterized protein